MKSESVKKKETRDKNFLLALKGERTETVPFWFMRQAGRYLPEYRETRKRAGGFLDLVFNPELATEATMQPVRRFGMSAAILFSDILVIPRALGQEVFFSENDGPVLGSFENLPSVCPDDVFSPVCKTVSMTRHALDREGFADTALIGFAGAPWTVACYMIEGRSEPGFPKAVKFARENPEEFGEAIERISDITVNYLCAQAGAGAEAAQIFDSWAGLAQEEEFQKWVVEPAGKIITAFRRSFPDVPVIGFPRGAGKNYELYARETGVDAISLDQSVTLDEAEALQDICTVQGNLDPEILLKGGAEMEESAVAVLKRLSGRPFVFNLGHGIVKETPPEHVDALSRFIRGWCA